MKKTIYILIICAFTTYSYAASDNFPPYVDAPSYTTFFADGIPNNVYHVRTTGNDSTGDGTYENAWLSLAGGQGTVAAGDLVLIHEGNHTFGNAGWSNPQQNSPNAITTDGTASDNIVFMAANKYTGYTSEAQPTVTIKDFFAFTLNDYQVLDGLAIAGGISIYSSNTTVQNNDFSVGCAGENDGNPAMIVFPSEGSLAQNTTIRNNSFHDSVGDHLEGNGRDYAIIMFDSNTNGIAGAWNSGYTKILYNDFYNFDGATSQEFIVYMKDTSHGVELGYNRFYNSNAFALAGFGQEGGIGVEGLDVHHNLVYNCDGLAFFWGRGYGDAKWRSNVVIDDGYSDVAYYMAQDAGWSYGMVAISTGDDYETAWGDVYDNIFYVDDPGEYYDGADASGTGYWEWVDYNAYVSTTVRDRFENAESASSNWQDNALTTSFTITVDGDYFATVPDDYVGLGQGRTGGNIGGFSWEAQTPPTFSGCTIGNVQ